MLITTTTGNENFERSSAKHWVFLSRPEMRPGGFYETVETHLFAAARSTSVTGVSRVSNNQVFPAAPGLIEEFGKWGTTTYDVPPETVLKIFGMRKGSQRVPPDLNAAVLVQVHPDAPMTRVTLPLSGDPRAQFSEVSTEGRFWVLSLEEAQALNIRPKFAHYFRPENREALFRIEELEPARGPRERVSEREVTNGDGQRVAVRRRLRGRALDV